MIIKLNKDQAEKLGLQENQEIEVLEEAKTKYTWSEKGDQLLNQWAKLLWSDLVKELNKAIKDKK